MLYRTHDLVYDATDLGSLAGYGGIKAIAINAGGQVTGNLENLRTDANEASVWTPDGKNGAPDNPQMLPLGNLSGQPDWIYNGSMAAALNFNGQVVGWADGAGRLVDHAHAVSVAAERIGGRYGYLDAGQRDGAWRLASTTSARP